MQINGTTPTNMQTPSNHPSFGMLPGRRLHKAINGKLFQFTKAELDHVSTLIEDPATNDFMLEVKRTICGLGRKIAIGVVNLKRPTQRFAGAFDSLEKGLEMLVRRKEELPLQASIADRMDAIQIESQAAL